MVAAMPSPKKKKNSVAVRTALAFIAGVALPVCLVLGWRVAYGQQDAPQDAGTARSRTAPAAAQAAVPLKPADIPPREELNVMRPLFQDMVRKATMERIERYRKQWSKAQKLQQVFEERRRRLVSLDQTYYDFVRSDVRDQMAKAGLAFGDSQYFVYVDRNPSAQFVLVGFYDVQTDAIEFLGADLASTGNIEKGGDYFETPTGVFENLVENFSYRALGTPNQEGWRGLGSKDSRVWDFGDQRGLKQYKSGNTLSQLRLLMHATDPDQGEQRLGRIDSKGCVRISKGLNHFLDTYAILDRNYEEWARNRTDTWLLKKDRTPVVYPGKYLIIGDSQPMRPAEPPQTGHSLQAGQLPRPPRASSAVPSPGTSETVQGRAQADAQAKP